MLSKTPIVVPLRDENAPNIFGGKLGKSNGIENFATNKKKNATFDKNAFITPICPRNRAPLGIKTTNAKIQAFQTPALSAKQLEQDINLKKATSTRRPRKLVHADNTKLVIHEGESPLTEPDVEYCPPAPKDIPYESDTFPENCLDYSYIRPDDLLRNIYKKNLDSQIDGSGLSLLEKQQEEAYQSRVKQTDEAVLKSMEENWTIENMPGTFGHQPKRHIQVQPANNEKIERKKYRAPHQGPSTLNSKSACLALSTVENPAKIQPKISTTSSKSSFLGFSRSKSTQKPLSSYGSENKCNSTSNTTSRSTIGYSKGRNVPRILTERERKYQGKIKLTKSASTMLETIAGSETYDGDNRRRRPSFLSVFDVDDGEIEPALRGIPPDCIRNCEDDEEFFITL
ncbi:hypothetical protein OnM2_037032 [Erysiphe neolycopersici]|uniref:Uncharacterized protein n=1 Tax=Erysiphe neolycopersici TaxID=212602 RepID=A0A420HX58_9PEZI|nr:hypothetical protein OnM2_037032 [Erysiphe neolycopersici]